MHLRVLQQVAGNFEVHLKAYFSEKHSQRMSRGHESGRTRSFQNESAHFPGVPAYKEMRRKLSSSGASQPGKVPDWVFCSPSTAQLHPLLSESDEYSHISPRSFDTRSSKPGIF